MDRITGDCEAVEGPCPFYDVGCPDGKVRQSLIADYANLISTQGTKGSNEYRIWIFG